MEEAPKSDPKEFSKASPSLLSEVHWSWLLPILKDYPNPEQKLLLAPLSPYARKNLTKALTLSQGIPKLSKALHAFLSDLLEKRLKEDFPDLLPKPFLPQTRLAPLLWKDKKALSRLIDLLAMHDLCLEIKHVVDTKILKKISLLLREDEKKMLKKLSQQKELFSLGKLELSGSEELLRGQLHKRGLTRLGSAISKEAKDFIWYICHQLDIGRGGMLFKLSQTPSPEETIDLLKEQVLEVCEEI